MTETGDRACWNCGSFSKTEPFVLAETPNSGHPMYFCDPCHHLVAEAVVPFAADA